MRRIFDDYAYGADPRETCWWDETAKGKSRPALAGDQRCDVAVIGAGFTGLTAALSLAASGLTVAVLDTHYPGWGASGRNGGFCCLGGSKASDKFLDRHFGRDGRLDFHRAEKAAVALVDSLTTTLGIDIDRHSQGETELAHRAKDMQALQQRAERVEENYGVSPTLIPQRDLRGQGLIGPFHGGLTTPIGFGLNPRKYIEGLAKAAEDADAIIYHDSPVTGLKDGYILETAKGKITADQVVVATNGYSSEDMPDWLSGRYMPTQSNVLVTRPLTQAEQQAGWHSDQMAYDTRNLLHYFRLMPDGRFLFGMRGGLRTGSVAERRAKIRLRRDFETMFPAWRHVESSNMWSGMVCLSKNLLPYVGPVPGQPGLWVAMCYHGNGVAMASFCGTNLADLVLGKPSALPAAMRQSLPRFPLGRARRSLMPAAYFGLMLADL
ncbi:MAG: FAD-binding oxidoreductase [Sulfitobacter sp.]